MSAVWKPNVTVAAVIERNGRFLLVEEETPEGVRLTGVPRDPTRTTYWGKDSAIFMEEMVAWLIKK